MTATTFTADRRSILGAGALAAAGATVSIPAAMSAASSLSAWDRATADYLAAKSQADAFTAAHYDPHYERWDADRNHAIPAHIDNEMQPHDDRVGDRETALMKMPAPNGAALRWKLDRALHVDFGEATSAWSEEYVRQTIADYRRLLG